MASIDEIVSQLIAKTETMEAFGKTIKLVLDGELVVIDGTTTPPTIRRDDVEADVMGTATAENFSKILNRDMNAQMAMMTGKIKVSGDMIAAIPLMKML